MTGGLPLPALAVATGTVCHVRRLVPADAQDYRALMLRAYAEHPDAFTSSAAERAALPLAWWERRLAVAADAPEQVFGAFAGEDLAGVAGLEFATRERTSHKCTLFGMYVRPRDRSARLGRALVEAVLAVARQRPSVRLVQLTVSEGNAAARGLYERCGFLAWGIEPMAVALEGGFVRKVHMMLDLREGGGHNPRAT